MPFRVHLRAAFRHQPPQWARLLPAGEGGLGPRRGFGLLLPPYLAQDFLDLPLGQLRSHKVKRIEVQYKLKLVESCASDASTASILD